MNPEMLDNLKVGFDQRTQRLVPAHAARAEDAKLISGADMSWDQCRMLADERWEHGAWTPMWVGDRLIDDAAMAAMTSSDPLYSFLVKFEVRAAHTQIRPKDSQQREVVGALNLPPAPPPNRSIRGSAVSLDLNTDTQCSGMYKSKPRKNTLNQVSASFGSHEAYNDTTVVLSKQVQDALTDNQCRLVSYTGHGTLTSISAYTGYLLTTSTPNLDEIAKNKVFFLHCCNSCAASVGLGPLLVQKKAIAVFGYEVPLIIVPNYQDEFHKAFFTAEWELLQGVTSDGKRNPITTGEAYKRGLDGFRSAATDLRQKSADYRVIAAIENDMYYFKGPDSKNSPYGQSDFVL